VSCDGRRWKEQAEWEQQVQWQQKKTMYEDPNPFYKIAVFFNEAAQYHS
jgi:hypothetical protein